MTKIRYTSQLAKAETAIMAILGSLPSHLKIVPASRFGVNQRESDTIIRVTHFLTEALNTVRPYLNAVEKED